MIQTSVLLSSQEGGQGATGPRRGATVLGVGALFLLLLFAGFTIGSSIDPALTDARADWLAANAAASGIDPWNDLRTLATELDTSYRVIGIYELGDVERIHPRTPGALLLMWPLTLLSADAVYPTMLLIAALLWAVTAGYVVRAFDWADSFPTIAGSALLVGSAAYLGTLKFGTQSTLLLLLAVVTWATCRERDSVAGAVALGLLMTLRLFPGLLLIPLWMFGRKKAVIAGISTMAISNVAGLLLYDLSLSDAVTALGRAGRNWAAFSGNGSLLMPFARLGLDVQIAGTLIVAGAIAICLFLPYRRMSFDLSLAFVLVIALISSPLSWEHYDVLAFLVVGYLLWGASYRGPTQARAAKVIVSAWVALQLVSPQFVHVVFGERSFTFAGPISLIGRGLLLAALVIAVISARSTPAADSYETERDPVDSRTQTVAVLGLIP